MRGYLQHYQKNQLNLNLLMHKSVDSRNANYGNRIDRANLNSNNSIALNRYENCEKTELLIDKIKSKTRGGWILKY
jgi:sulfate adenylyltransferase subunit 1 (EFTu-like GTPase family)